MARVKVEETTVNTIPTRNRMTVTGHQGIMARDKEVMGNSNRRVNTVVLKHNSKGVAIMQIRNKDKATGIMVCRSAGSWYLSNLRLRDE